jgi:hypothetical protein
MVKIQQFRITFDNRLQSKIENKSRHRHDDPNHPSLGLRQGYSGSDSAAKHKNSGENPEKYLKASLILSDRSQQTLGKTIRNSDKALIL